jgi:hypothetical protein
MHSAIAEVGVLYATSSVHAGWDHVGADGLIEQSQSITGGHAFAIVAYDEHGFWIQNSWGTSWGFHGFGRISYDDWLANATDTWVARLGAPVVLLDPHTTAAAVRGTAKGSQSYVFRDLRPHIISLGNDGQPRTDGTYGTSAKDIETIFETDFRMITAGWPKKFGKRRLLLYAHGGLVNEDSAIQMVADDRETLLAAGIYPVSFIWKTDYLDTLKDILEDALRRRRPEGALDATKDFMLDRLDDALEPLARVASGLLEWSQMKQNAIAATASATGGARIAARCVDALMKADPSLDLHMVGHSAGLRSARAAADREGRHRRWTAQREHRLRAHHRELHALGAGLHDGPLPSAVRTGDRGRSPAAVLALHADRQGGARRRLREHLPQVLVVSREQCAGEPTENSDRARRCPHSGHGKVRQG